jgi:hypothetical protein
LTPPTCPVALLREVIGKSLIIHLNANLVANLGMHRVAVQKRHWSTRTVLERGFEESEELHVCGKCGAAHTRIIELIEDEMEHVTPETES